MEDRRGLSHLCAARSANGIDEWHYVVFPCGYTLAPDGDTLHVYYGAADTSIALATGSVRAMLEWLEQHS